MKVERDEEVVVEEEQDDLEPEVEEETDESESDEDQEEESPDEEESEDEDEDEEERVVLIGEEAPEDDEEKPDAPGWVKKVRKVNRKLESENKKLRKELEQRSSAAPQAEPPIEVGEKPTLKSAGYDDKKYEQALTEYYERKRKAEEQEAKKSREQEEVQKKWQERQAQYAAKKIEHSFKDYEDAEELVSNTFSVTQQGIIIQGAEDSALVVYALGKNPKKLEELAKETDPVSFAFKVAKLESQLKVQNKKAPAPEKRVPGKSGGLSGSEDKTLERLRKEAEKTGDYTKVTKYKRDKKRKK